MFEVSLILGASLFLAYPIGRYMANIFSGQVHFSDRFFSPLEKLLYRLMGVNPDDNFGWQKYIKHFLVSNAVLLVLAFIGLMLQQHLPLNPDAIGPLSWHLALHTAISFLTNTDQQHYSGQSQLSYWSQSGVLVTLQFISPAMGLAICVAVLRAMRGDKTLGNFYVDLVRGILRLLLPLSIIFALLLTSQGVPSNFDGAISAQTVENAQPQIIPTGPVAALVAIKQLGSNGGGWFGPNSAHPFENPTPLSNALEILLILLLPMAVVFMAGRLLRNSGFTRLTLLSMTILSAICIAGIFYSEQQPNTAFMDLSAQSPNMEGKEVRFGSLTSALWATVTTQTSNGSVNNMHDSLNPIGGLVTRSGMLINAIWGGVGCGLINFIVYIWMTVFLAGLMTGRTPEVFGRKIEKNEILLLAILLILPVLCILGFTAIAVSFPSITANSHSGFHGLSQVFYEYASAYANNGSGFEGLGDNTVWWNLSTSVCLLLGRYLPLLLPLMIAANMAEKRVAPSTLASLHIDNVTFGGTLIAVIVIVNFLSFLPSMVLGPIGEALLSP